MLGYGWIAKGRVDDVGISLKVSKVRTTEDQQRDASHVEIRDAKSYDHVAHMTC